MSGHDIRRWPLFLIAAPAAVAVWSGWVGLGELCGFGIVRPLPGIADGLQLNTAITLPIGVEAYAAFALGAWLAPLGVPQRARTFAKRSAIGALALGMAGQVIYHVLAASHAVRALARAAGRLRGYMHVQAGWLRLGELLGPAGPALQAM